MSALSLPDRPLEPAVTSAASTRTALPSRQEAPTQPQHKKLNQP